MDIVTETSAGATSSGSVATVSQPMMATERRVNPSIYANQDSKPTKMDDHCPECKCNPCECHEESRKAPTAPKAKEFGLWQNSVLAGKAQKDKKKSKATNESVKILKTTKTPTGKQVQGNYGLDYQPEEKLDMYGHSMRGSPKLHSLRIPDNKYPGQGPGRPENISSTDAFDVLKRDPFGRDSNMTEDDLEEDWEGIKNAGKKAIGAGAIGLAALGGGAQAQTAPANTGTNATIVKSLVNPVAQQRFAKLHSDTTAQLKDPKYTHNPDALAQHENYPKERHSQYIQNVKNIEQWQNPYQIISIALNKAGLTPQEVLQNLPKGYKLPSTEPKSEPVRIPGDPGYKAPVNEFKKPSKKINERDFGHGQRKLKLAEVDKDNKKSIGPDKNDPFEKGWRARYNDDNPYTKGTKEYKEWQHGKDEREAQPNHYDESINEATGDEKFDNMMGGIVQGVKKPSIGSRLMAPFKRMKDRGQVAAQSRFYKQMIDKYHNLASDSMNSTTDYEFDDERRFPHEDQFSKYMSIARYFEMLRGDMKLHAPFIQNIRKNNPELAKYQPLNAGKNSDLYAEPALPKWVPAHNSIIDIEHRPVKITHTGKYERHLGVEWISAYGQKHYEEFLIEDLENLQDFLIQVEDEINFNDEREGREGYGRDLDEAANSAQQAAIAIAKKKKGVTKQVDEIDMSIVGDALAGASLGLGAVGVGSYIGHKIGNKIGQKFVDRANRKEAERQAKYDKEQFGGPRDIDMDDWDDDEDIEEGKTGPGLWTNIHKKQNRIKNGSGEHMRKPGSKGAPTSANFKAASNTESVAEAVEDHTKIKVSKISSKYPGTNILTGSSTVRVGRKGKTPIGTFPTFEIDGHRYITLADANKIERALKQDVAEDSNTKVTKTPNDIRAINKAFVKQISAQKKSKR